MHDRYLNSRSAQSRLILPIKLIRQVIEEESDENGWAHLNAAGSYLTKIRPDFDPRLYRHTKLSVLFKKNPQHFQLEERAIAGSRACLGRYKECGKVARQKEVGSS